MKNKKKYTSSRPIIIFDSIKINFLFEYLIIPQYETYFVIMQMRLIS